MKKALITKCRNLIEDLQAEKEARDNFYSEKSEKWQDSEKGETYQAITDEIEYMYDELENHLNEIESLNEE
jgi:hypothetical protein